MAPQVTLPYLKRTTQNQDQRSHGQKSRAFEPALWYAAFILTTENPIWWKKACFPCRLRTASWYFTSSRKSKRGKMYEVERIIERRKTERVSRFFVSILNVDPFVKLMRQNGGPNFPSQVKNGQPRGSFIHRNLVSAYKTSPIMPYQVCRIHLVNKLRSHWWKRD